MILLIDFARQRDVKADTIATFIRRHPEMFEGHIQQQGNKMLLDEEAEKILDEKYPIPKPTIIVDGMDPKEFQKVLQEKAEVLDKLANALGKLEKLQDELTEYKLLVGEKNANLLMLEDKKEILEGKNQLLEVEKQLLEEENARMKESVSQLNVILKETTEKLEMEQNKTWIQKLFGK